MAQQSMFWTTNGTGDGPSGGYNQQRIYDRDRKIFITDQGASQGVLKGTDNELFVTGTASPLTLKSGAAFVYGLFYENSADLNVAIPTPAATTGGRVVLRADWVQQTISATGTMSASGVTDPPALTQNAGTLWEISLATFTITSGGTITLADGRSYCHFGTMVGTDQIDDDAITAAKISAGAVGASEIAANAVGSSELADDAVDTNAIANDAVDDTKLRNSAALSVIGRASNSTGNPADIAAGSDGDVLRRSGTTLGFGQIATAGIADDAITTAKIAANAVGSAAIAANAVTSSELANDAVDTAAIADGAVSTAKIAAGAVTDTELGALSVGTSKIVSNAVTTAKINDGAVTTAKLDTDSVDDTIAGNRVPQFYRRAGGNATNWGTAGDSIYTPTAVRMQAGAASAGTIGPGAVAAGTINFPVAFSGTPIAFCQVFITDGSGAAMVARVTNIAVDTVNFTVENLESTVTGTATVNWLVIGPE